MTRPAEEPAVVEVAGPWREVELELTATASHPAAYRDVSVWAEFRCGSDLLRRPAFWDGGSTWRVRFAAPYAGDWDWTVAADVADPGLTGPTGTLRCREAEAAGHAFVDHGFWRMSASGRHVVHVDGTPALVVADTAWALPWRATEDQVVTYARDRRAKGFNAVLLMSVQPDMRAVGPRDRTRDEGFDVGFEDLPQGRLEELVPAYFRTLDRLLDVLVEHELVPVLQPVFQGFGWKGLEVAGTVVSPEDYARYCRYLVARYGARPAVWLVGADGTGTEPQLEAGGREVHAWDAYAQPTGLHYQPHATNRVHQDADWLDFQWCQTGHDGEHAPDRVADMWRNTPPKGVLNAEPTYEHTGESSTGAHGAGWWQGHEAWSNLCAGGTMGVGYGAASLWQWRLHADEPGHAEYFLGTDAGWREALDFEGSAYVGLLGRLVRQLPFLDMAPDWTHAIGNRALSVPGELVLVYRENGRPLTLTDPALPRHLSVVDPRTGEVLEQREREPAEAVLADAGGQPRVYVFTREPVAWR